MLIQGWNIVFGLVRVLLFYFICSIPFSNKRNAKRYFMDGVFRIGENIPVLRTSYSGNRRNQEDKTISKTTQGMMYDYSTHNDSLDVETPFKCNRIVIFLNL